MINTTQDWLTAALDLVEKQAPGLTHIQHKLLQSALLDIAVEDEHESSTPDGAIDPNYAYRLLLERIGGRGQLGRYASELEAKYNAERHRYSEELDTASTPPDWPLIQS